MSSKHNPEKNTPWQDDLPYQGHDPIEGAWRGRRPLYELWLKNGETQTPFQKVGFTILSLMSIGMGVCMYADFWTDLLTRNLNLFWTLMSSLLVIPGLIGLRNVFRSQRKEPEKRSNDKKD